MLSSSFKEHIAQILGSPIIKADPVSGGDISSAYCIHTSTHRYFLKVNERENASKMFLTEKLGLDTINRTNAIKAPEVVSCGQYHTSSFILMEFIEPKNPTSKEMEAFGTQLADLHTFPVGESFGWKQDNYIGSLAQSNKNHPDWALFYVYERLLPQLVMAREKELLSSYEVPSESILLNRCQHFFPEVQPALLHGDLWSGNYIISTQGIPYLIDPAVYYGHHEVDLAMTRLFGGFSSKFHAAYAEQIPIGPLYNERMDIYQLYYLLVHLNLFGRSYYPSVKRLLKTYFP
ncbi:MAG: fructosamine kinase family protein [Maribacter sp.]|nr:fructosamine kinase family protein [Maribacter sp.]